MMVADWGTTLMHMLPSFVGNSGSPRYSIWGISAPSRGTARATALGPACVKTRAFNLRVESSSQFDQSENQRCWRRLSEEGNRENRSMLSLLAHVFTRPGSIRYARRLSTDTYANRAL